MEQLNEVCTALRIVFPCGPNVRRIATLNTSELAKIIQPDSKPGSDRNLIHVPNLFRGGLHELEVDSWASLRFSDTRKWASPSSIRSTAGSERVASIKPYQQVLADVSRWEL